MKVILTGATGFIGSEVLAQLLGHPRITSVVVLSRRALPSAIPPSPKLKTIIMEDFTKYPPAVMAELTGAEACIWNLVIKNASPDIHREVTIGYTSAAASAFSALSHGPSAPFRLVFMSGVLAVRDPAARVLFFAEQRRLKGAAEALVLADGGVRGFVLRPGGVAATGDAGVLHRVAKAAGYGISVEELAAAAVGIAVEGAERRVWENRELVEEGRKWLDGVRDEK